MTGDVVSTPERNLVEFHPQPGPGEARHEKLIVAELLAGSNGQSILSGQTETLPLDRRLR